MYFMSFQLFADQFPELDDFIVLLEKLEELVKVKQPLSFLVIISTSRMVP